MTVNIVFSGTTYPIPQQAERNWANIVNAFFQGLAANALPKSGGNFTLAADLNLGNTGQVYVKALASNTAGIAAAGFIKLAKTDVIGFRNNAGDGDLALGIDASDRLTFNGVVLSTASSAVTLTGAQSVADKSLVNVAAITMAAGSSIDWAPGSAAIAASLGINTLSIGGSGSTIYVPGIFKSKILTTDDDFIYMNADALSTGSDWRGILKRPQTGMLSNATYTLPLTTTTLMGRDTTDTVTNKSYTSALFTNEAIFTAITTPATPGAGLYKVYPKADNKFYVLAPSGVETAIGSGSGSGGINYIDEGDFETTANGATPTGWAAYFDAAGAAPVDGTGGSPNAAVTFLASNTSPIRGLMSAIFTKDAANRQGQGWSKNFTIAAPDKGKKAQLKVEIDCSANYVAGDCAFYIYDTTNNLLITPSTAAIPKLTSGSWQITFDTTTSTTYRLIMHIATVSALAYTVKVDTLVLNAEFLGSGTPNGPVSLTTVFNNATGMTITDALTFDRVGQNLIINGYLQVSGDGTLGSVFSLSWANLTIASAQSGSVRVEEGVTNYVKTFIAYSQGTSLAFYTQNNGSVSSVIVNGNNMGASSGRYKTFYFNGVVIRINEWAGQQMAFGAGATVEYAYSTDATTTAGNVQADNGLYGNGPQGTPFLAIASSTLSSTTVKRVRFPTPIQSDDLIQFETSDGAGSAWIPVEQRGFAVSFAGRAEYGVRIIRVSGSATDVNVYFGNAGYNSNSGAGGVYESTNTAPWSALTGLNWRLRKAKSSAPVGIVMQSSVDSGLGKATAMLGFARNNTSSGYGSTNTCIRRIPGIVTAQGSDFTLADSATLGCSITIVNSGIYSIGYTDEFSQGASMGLSKNSSQLNSNIASITSSDRLAMVSAPGANLTAFVSYVGYLAAGDVVRPLADTSPSGASTSRASLTIQRLA